jgi:uncharacterized protein YdeI (YjbR/CyaY-like superfamily)
MTQEHGGALDGADVVAFEDVEQWIGWLADHHELRAGVWVKIAKKGSGHKSITITEALDGALCFGWIDSRRRSCDRDHYLQRYSPRRPNGSWSKVNVDKVEALVAAGRMREPGYAVIDAAKADGRWDAAYAPQRGATVPDDLAAALAADEPARTAFEALDRTRRYALLLRLMKARTPATRTARLERLVASLAKTIQPTGRRPIARERRQSSSSSANGSSELAGSHDRPGTPQPLPRSILFASRLYRPTSRSRYR